MHNVANRYFANDSEVTEKFFRFFRTVQVGPKFRDLPQNCLKHSSAFKA